MHDLCCARCARILIADFWDMVRDETVPTFTQICLTCSCGNRIRVNLEVRPQYRTFHVPRREIALRLHA